MEFKMNQYHNRSEKHRQHMDCDALRGKQSLINKGIHRLPQNSGFSLLFDLLCLPQYNMISFILQWQKHGNKIIKSIR